MKPKYWAQACDFLKAEEPPIGELIDRYSGETLSSHGRAFETLARSIVGQQISVKAADTVWRRFVDVVGQATPESLIQFSPSQLRGAGLSVRKAEYVIEMAERFHEGEINPRRWRFMRDDELIEDITRLRGIGRWTAEMFMIFHLLRPNVFPVDDIGLQRALANCYKKRHPMSPRQLEQFRRRFSPWCTVATWYLWRHLDPVPVEY